MLSEWWPAVPSTPSPLNLKAVPEERAEIIHGKAWLLGEVAWGGNSRWGGVQFPELHLDLVTVSTQPPPGSTMWASHSVKDWMGCSGPHVLLGLALDCLGGPGWSIWTRGPQGSFQPRGRSWAGRIFTHPNALDEEKGPLPHLMRCSGHPPDPFHLYWPAGLLQKRPKLDPDTL